MVSRGGIAPDRNLLWVIMVTSAENRRWPEDVSLEEDHAGIGLPVPSLARTAKIATISAADAEWRGDVGPDRLRRIQQEMRGNLAMDAAD